MLPIHSDISYYLQLSYHLYVWYPPTRITNWLNITKDIILLASPPKTEFPLRNKLSASRIYTHISKARFQNRWYLIWWWNFRRFIVFFGQTFSFILCDCEVSNCINNERNGLFFCSYVLLEWPLLVYLVNVFLLLGPRPKSKQSGWIYS